VLHCHCWLGSPKDVAHRVMASDFQKGLFLAGLDSHGLVSGLFAVGISSYLWHLLFTYPNILHFKWKIA
jgi:hypothetical protein